MERDTFGLNETSRIGGTRKTLSGIIDDSDAIERVTQVDVRFFENARVALNTVAPHQLTQITPVDERVKLSIMIDEILSR